ncbi:MAG: vanadium-dependent haloperoxidase, partial [Pseudomonadota bacterium]
VAPAMINGVAYAAGDVIPVSKDLIGVVINQGFIDQALEVIEYSATLTDEGKIIAEFWEDGGGTAFPPGTFMAFAQFVSARDNNTLDEDAQMFLAMSNAVMDAGIATWNAKVEYDYVRPVRAIRELGELGLIGEWGTDHEGNEGYVIEAFGGIDPLTGVGLGTQTILATDFVTFQRPDADPSPPFAEYTSGHSAFSSAGAEVLLRFTGSDDFGGAVTFAPGSTQFESGVPLDEVTLAWDTFSQAADEAGESRLYGGIHFTEGDLNSRDLGRQVGGDAYDLAQKFINGTATDEDRPFFVEDAFMI